tara:strand:+ start:30 stop:764 length:735 start_codon:yes stop_codon:yes gene_type:complete
MNNNFKKILFNIILILLIFILIVKLFNLNDKYENVFINKIEKFDNNSQENTELTPHLAENDLKIFYKYLNNSKYYFEYGSGGSTYEATKRKNIKYIYSVESDKEWYNKLKSKITDQNKIKFIYVNLNTLPNTWGSPGKYSTFSDWVKYSRQILYLSKEKISKIDMIFIDGRFRAACCLNCYSVINNNCKILFDDFLNRKQYHIVLKFFKIIEKTKDNRMVVLEKILNIEPPSKELINKYEKIKD